MKSVKNTLIMGDFNFLEVDWNTYSPVSAASSECREFICKIGDCFYTNMYWNPQSDAILNLILTIEPDLVSEVQINSSLGNSDHNIKSFKVHVNSDKSERKYVRYNKVTMKLLTEN